MAKLIELTEAAKILGISSEELTEMRSRNEIFGYRDGSTWKFKTEEVDRVKASLAPPAALGGVDDIDDLNIGLDDDLVDADDSPPISLDDDDADVIEPLDGDDSDSILVSEEELGKSDENTASTIIGEADDLLPQGSDASDALTGESDLELTLENSGIVSASDAVSASDVLGDAELPPNASDTNNLNAIAGISDDDLKLSADSGSLDLGLEDAIEGGSRIEVSDDSQASSSGFGSAIDLGLDDDELVLGSGSGSDITSGAGDSGINIANPSDSGLSLEDPMEMSAGGSGIESLELGEDDGIIDDMGGVDSADDFMLEPVEDGMDEESDSGSQVIALDSEEFDDSGAAGLIDDETLDENAFEAVEGFDDDADGGFDDVGLAAAGATAAAGLGTATAVASSDDASTYSVWNVLSLFCIMSLLGLTGIMMLDLINNIWSWDEPYSINSTLMNAILGLMPG